MELVTRQAVASYMATQEHSLNVYFEEHDLNDRDFGIQGFVYKKVFDAGVATSIGSPVGSTLASGGGTVTPDQSDAGKAGVLGRGGGLAQVAVAANVTRYGWVQNMGINRVAAKTTGALAAGDLGVWTDDDTIAIVGTDEEMVFCHCLVAAASGSVAAGGLLLLGR